MIRRVPLPGRRELCAERSAGLVFVWIHDIARDRCASGPFCVREGEIGTLVSVLLDVGAGAERKVAG